CYAVLPYVGYRSLGSVFLLAILVVSSLSNRGPILFAALISAVVWNFFFIPPLFTFIISSWEDSMMVLSFFVTAIVGGWLTSRIRKQEIGLLQREEKTIVLYDLSRRLASAKDENEISQIIREVLLKQFQSESVLLFEKENRIKNESALSERDFAVATWVFEQGQRAGWSTQTLTAADCLCLPMTGQAGAVGVVAMFPKDKTHFLTIEQEHFLDTVISQGAIAIERLRFIEEAGQKRLLESSEKLHQTLINSVSHELRTPITTIIGTATALNDEKTFSDKSAREALTLDLVQSAKRLDRVVENLLDMSRLEKGTMQLKKEWFEVRELIREALAGLNSEKLTVKTKGDVQTLIKADFKLLQHALFNILANAAKYSNSKEILVVVKALPQNIEVSVSDSGPGIPEEMREQIFEKFFRLPGTPAGGIGLGLSIVKSIVELHGGAVRAQTREDGQPGAQFIIRLPLENVPAELKEVIR
ncbi:MAG: ATP-binding protein, partial [Bdellovibrionota bacterium]